MRRIAPLLIACSFVLAACNSDTPVQTDNHLHHAGLVLSDLNQASSAQALSDLRAFTAPLHDVDAAEALHYGLLVAPPLTAADGCISDMTAGGMGYHYTRGNNLADDAITLTDPEFLVYAPTNAPRVDGVARRRLAAVEYFIPFSPTWPAPGAAGFTRAPSLHDFPTTSTLPDSSFAPTTRFGGWMFHIWLWEQNPDGMFKNFNTSVPLCEGSSF